MSQNEVSEFGCKTPEQVQKRKEIVELERYMLDMLQVDIKTTHHFAHGLYAREIFIPAGTLLTGKIHRTEHLNIVSVGELYVMTEDGMKLVQAGAHLVSRPGTKRVGYAKTDCIWTTIHATEEQDLVKLEAELIAPDFAQIETAKPDLLEE